MKAQLKKWFASRHTKRMNQALAYKEALLALRQQLLLDSGKPMATITGADMPQPFPKMAYVHKTFSQLRFGQELGGAQQEVEEVYFYASTFQNCHIANVKFVNCVFYAVAFEDTYLENVVFDHCRFSECEELAVGDAPQEACCVFRNCQLLGGYQSRAPMFQSCKLQCSVWEGCRVERLTFLDCALWGSVFDESALKSVEFAGGALYNLAILRPKSLDLYFSAIEDTLVDERFLVDFQITDASQKTKLGQSMRRLTRLLEYHNLSAVGGECRYWAKVSEESELTGLERIYSIMGRVVCGYGERPTFTLCWLLGQAFFFSVVYLFAGISTPMGIVDYNLFGVSQVTDTLWIDYLKCLLLSFTTFTTVGYGNYLPATPLCMLATCTQMLLGMGLGALWTGCIVRKLSR